MNERLNPLNERTEELLSALVTEGLDSPQQTEFDSIDWNSLGTTAEIEIARFEEAAAAFAVAFDNSSNMESLPNDLSERISADAIKYVSGSASQSANDPGSLGAATSRNPIATPVNKTSVLAPPNWREWFSVLAAAACLAILLFNWPATQTRPSPSAADQMAMLIKTNPVDLVTADWTQVHNKSTTGKVHWSDQKNEGYMVFNGLPVNDPTKQQYQLWVFDTDAEQAHPVDGGVFDISSTGEVIIPIDVRIPVKKAVMFAVTIEEPGGVVVSKREQIPVLATVE